MELIAAAGRILLACVIAGAAWLAYDVRIGSAGPDASSSEPDSLATLEGVDLKKLASERPLDPEPFEAAAYQTLLGNGEASKVAAFTKAALERSPRSRLARLVSLEQAYRSRQWGLVIDQADALYTLWPRQRRDILPIFDALFADPRSRPLLIDRMRGRPAWGEGLARRLNLSRIDLQTALDVVEPYPSAHGRLINSLTSQGRFDLAYLAWTLLLAETGAADGELTVPFDARFKGLDAPEPFNWQINSSHAERLPAGGLYVSYFGRERPRIARQLLPLTPGRYRFDMTFDGRIPDAGGDVEWRIDCTASRKTPMVARISDWVSEEETGPVEFDIPSEGCDFQWLSLNGRPGEYPQPLRMTIESITIQSVAEGP